MCVSVCESKCVFRWQCRRDYFDSRKQVQVLNNCMLSCFVQVLAFVTSSKEWAESMKVYYQAIKADESSETSRVLYVKQYKEQMKQEELQQEMPPSPGGHDSFCFK